MNAVVEKPIPEISSAQSRPSRRSVRRKLPWVLGGVALIGAVVFGNWYMVEGRFLETTDDAYVQGDITVLSPRIDGDVLSIPVSDNQPVHAGDPLIMLDPRDWQTRLDQAQAAAAEADAAVTTAARQVMQQRSAIAAAEAAVSQAQAGLVLANADAARAAELVRTGAVSRQFNDQAVAEQRKNDAATVSARAQVTAAEQQLAGAERAAQSGAGAAAECGGGGAPGQGQSVLHGDPRAVRWRRRQSRRAARRACAGGDAVDRRGAGARCALRVGEFQGDRSLVMSRRA